MWRIIKRYYSKKLAHEIMGTGPKNSIVNVNEKFTLMEKISTKVGDLFDNIEIFLNAVDEIAQEEALQRGLLPISNEENSILKARYDYVPSKLRKE